MLLKPSYKTEIYVGSTGYLILHQERDGSWGDPVILSPEQCAYLSVELPKYMKQQDTVWLLEEPK